MLKAINIFKIHQNLFKYWFTLLHFALDDPVQQSEAAVEPNDVIVTLGLLSKQHIVHTPISHISLVIDKV